MTDEDALLAAMRERPHDHTPRLVLADWYDDHDMPHEAAYHRAVVTSRQAAEATARVGDYVNDTYRDGSIHQVAAQSYYRDAAYASYRARERLNDNRPLSYRSDPVGHPLLAADHHADATMYHIIAAEKAEQYNKGDTDLSRLHRDASTAHNAARLAVSAIGGVTSAGDYRETTGRAPRTGYINGVVVHTDSETERAAVNIRFQPTGNGRIADVPHREMHAGEFHRLHEPVTK